jgi:hypothetical protein
VEKNASMDYTYLSAIFAIVHTYLVLCPFITDKIDCCKGNCAADIMQSEIIFSLYFVKYLSH